MVIKFFNELSEDVIAKSYDNGIRYQEKLIKFNDEMNGVK